MYRLEGKSNEIMNAIFQDMSLEENPHKKWGEDSDTFMPLVAEVIMPFGFFDKYKKNINLVSLAHYYTMNGDLMRDPEMVFVRVGDHVNLGKYLFYPISYQLDSLGLMGMNPLQESVTFGPDEDQPSEWKTYVNNKVQKDQTEFATQWLRTLDDQQKILENPK